MSDHIDFLGKKLTVGARVHVYGDPGVRGTVEAISDLDVIDGDYGVPQGVNPRVTVKFDDGVEDAFETHSTATGPWDDDGTFKCDDLVVLAGSA